MTNFIYKNVEVMKWKIHILVFAALSLLSYQSISQTSKKHSNWYQIYIDEKGDTLYAQQLEMITITAKAIGKGKRIAAERKLLRYNVYKVYPYVRSTVAMLNNIDSANRTITNSKLRNTYKKEKEKELFAQYKPVVKEMTFSQGKIIVLLINRDTGKECYEIIKDMKGGFQAIFWQGVARLFDNNLKRKYEPLGKDREIEDIVIQIQNGVPY